MSIESENWTEIPTQPSAADRKSLLEPDDLERLATAAYLIGIKRKYYPENLFRVNRNIQPVTSGNRSGQPG